MKQLIEENQTNEEWRTYLQGLNPYSVEGIEQYMQSNQQAKSWFDSTVDKQSARSLETWKANHLESAVDAENQEAIPG
ncbi:hypothetical protein J2T18_001122 [Paenibacillus polymyxa]|uniref:hypothetical protein n=1 Tax=Paenibacillus polymyxa TaxID=1406 RepID=UPI00278E59B9|nr:hypothetical protein [Paenibacillus polymyxa]MDQ0046850.1 hypothetical protein [Paenibacillus polymyxa]